MNVLFIFIILTFGSAGRVESVRMVGPYSDYGLCNEHRNQVPDDPDAWKTEVSACIEIGTESLPRCLDGKLCEQRELKRSI
jgi:hypothetical protein